MGHIHIPTLVLQGLTTLPMQKYIGGSVIVTPQGEPSIVAVVHDITLDLAFGEFHCSLKVESAQSLSGMALYPGMDYGLTMSGIMAKGYECSSKHFCLVNDEGRRRVHFRFQVA